MHSMLCDYRKWFGWKCSKGLKDPLKGFLGLVMFEFEFLVGSDILIVIVSESCLNMVIGGKGRCFSLEIMIWHLTSFELKKNDKKFSVGDWRNPETTQAEPSWGFRLVCWAIYGLPRKYTGGTHFWVPPDPPDLKNLAVRIFDPRDDFQIFRKLLKTKI